MPKKIKEKVKTANWGLIIKKAKEMENIRKMEEVKYCVRRLYELLCK